MNQGRFITFEGTEGSGKSTQIERLKERLRGAGCTLVQVREPGGTPIGEEIRHTLKHSPCNQSMTPEAELLLMNASRAQLVREVIRPALAAGQWVLCDRFADSTTVYQGWGRGLDRDALANIVAFAVGPTWPDLTLLLMVPLDVSEARRQTRAQSGPVVRDRMEEADRAFFERVEAGYRALAAAEPDRVKLIDATASIEAVAAQVWVAVEPMLR